VLLLKWILQDWNHESCRKLLKVCRAALPDHGRLLVVERLLPKEISTSIPLNPAIAMDSGMLVNFGDARERYLEEYEELPACQLPTGSSPCTSLGANSSIMLRSYSSIASILSPWMPAMRSRRRVRVSGARRVRAVIFCEGLRVARAQR
jgi:O-methyltransferase domain